MKGKNEAFNVQKRAVKKSPIELISQAAFSRSCIPVFSFAVSGAG